MPSGSSGPDPESIGRPFPELRRQASEIRLRARKLIGNELPGCVDNPDVGDRWNFSGRLSVRGKFRHPLPDVVGKEGEGIATTGPGWITEHVNFKLIGAGHDEILVEGLEIAVNQLSGESGLILPVELHADHSTEQDLDKPVIALEDAIVLPGETVVEGPERNPGASGDVTDLESPVPVGRQQFGNRNQHPLPLGRLDPVRAQ